MAQIVLFRVGRKRKEKKKKRSATARRRVDLPDRDKRGQERATDVQSPRSVSSRDRLNANPLVLSRSIQAPIPSRPIVSLVSVTASEISSIFLSQTQFGPSRDGDSP
jgi:hypothetical protein